MCCLIKWIFLLTLLSAGVFGYVTCTNMPSTKKEELKRKLLHVLDDDKEVDFSAEVKKNFWDSFAAYQKYWSEKLRDFLRKGVLWWLGDLNQSYLEYKTQARINQMQRFIWLLSNA